MSCCVSQRWTPDDPATVVAALSANAVAVVAIGGVSILAMFVFFIEGARMGRRDRVYPMALCDDGTVLASQQLVPAALQ